MRKLITTIFPGLTGSASHAQADKFGQAVLDIQDVGPGEDSRPDELTVTAIRNQEE